MKSETESQQKTITVDPSVYERFEEERKGTKTDHSPAMDQTVFLCSLLDTQEAVREGYYDDE